tara:strand:- start:150 stop:1322 length:1173 start_codon:yes stop_codon:yes gene_type:complete
MAILIPSGFYSLEGLIVALIFFNSFFFFKKPLLSLNNFTSSSSVLVLYFAIHLFSFMYAENLSSQLRSVVHNLSFLLLPIAFNNFEIKEKEIIKVQKFFIWSTFFSILIAFIYAFYSYVDTGKSTIYIKDSVQSKFSYYGLTRVYKDWHPTYVSFFVNIALLFSYQVFFKKGKFVLWCITTILFAAGIYFLNSFTGIFILIVLLSLFMFALIESKPIKGLAFATLLASLFLIYKYNPLNLNKISKFKGTNIEMTDTAGERNILNLRLVKWKAAYTLFKANPILGTSSGDVRDSLVNFYIKNGFIYAAKRRFTPHNQFLYVLASFGLIGIIVFIGLLVYPIGHQTDLTIFIILFSLYCLTEDILQRQQGQVFFVFTYLLLLQKQKNHVKIV